MICLLPEKKIVCFSAETLLMPFVAADLDHVIFCTNIPRTSGNLTSIFSSRNKGGAGRGRVTAIECYIFKVGHQLNVV